MIERAAADLERALCFGAALADIARPGPSAAVVEQLSSELLFIRKQREAARPRNGAKARRGFTWLCMLFDIQAGRCALCDGMMAPIGEGFSPAGQPHSPYRATLEHVMPKALGGLDALENCVAAHAECNTKKGGRSPTVEEQAKLAEIQGKLNARPA